VAHPVGGAVLGRSTDLYGRLHGYRGLYCLDGALMPGSTAAANPALTIAAVTERCLDRILTDFGPP
jgi:cholesterol oxidase